MPSCPSGEDICFEWIAGTPYAIRRAFNKGELLAHSHNVSRLPAGTANMSRQHPFGGVL
jgi:hypothetical protein